MKFLRTAFARIRGLLSDAAANRDAEEELRAHLDLQIADYVERGMPPEEARRRALAESGGLVSAAEAMRDQRTMPSVVGLGADIRYALRGLRASPLFTFVVVITLALGIGANTAIFSVVRGVLLKPLPHRDGERLIYLRHSIDGPTGGDIGFSVPEVTDLREGARSLAGIAEFSEWTVALKGNEGVVRIPAGLVTGNYFDVMGLSPILGRLTGPSDDGIGVPPVAVLTYDTWQKRFGADSSVVGTQLQIEGKSVTVIGVLQPAPFFPHRVEALLNMVISAHHTSAMMVQGRTHRMTEVVARLTPTATFTQAKTEVAEVMRRAQAQYPQFYNAADHHRVTALSFREALGERAALTLYLLMGVAAFVLIIAVANVANLTLMRGIRREHELVVRAALGAGLARLRRLLLVENVLIAVVGAAIGAAVSYAGVGMLTMLIARYSPRAAEIRVDGVVLTFALVTATIVALVLSLLATLPREGTLASSVLAGARRVSGNERKLRLQRALVVVQVAVCVVLIAGAGLLTKTMVRLSQVDTGLQTEQILTMNVPLLTPTQLMSDPSADGTAKERYAEMQRQLLAIPGVTAVGIGSPTPLRLGGVRFEMRAEGKTLQPGEAAPRVEFRTADPSFFRAAGIPMLAGRPFRATDVRGAERVTIINKALAQSLFGDADPIGRRIAWTGDVLRFTPISPEWRTVVGVVANTQDGGLDAPVQLAAYMPFAQELAMGGGVVVRADSNVSALATASAAAVRRVAPLAPIEDVMTVAQIKDTSVAPRRLNALLVSALGSLALLIATVGIAGVLAFSVNARTTEIGIRMSLGADRNRIQAMILREGGVLLVAGLLLGTLVALSAIGAIRGLLFGVSPRDVGTFAGAGVAMAIAGLLACWIPAVRAARIDPAITMRN